MRNRLPTSVAGALIAAAIVVAPVHVRPVVAAAELSVTKQAPSVALAGDAIDVGLTASNPGDAPEFNLTFREILPPGVQYASTTQPSGVEPTIAVNQIESPVGSGTFVDQQTLIWTNVADLQAGDSFQLEFRIQPNTTPGVPSLPTYFVGSDFSSQGEAYASPLPRVVPRFDADGVPLPGQSDVDSAISNTRTTTLTALEVTKSEPSPEGELLRGLHDFSTVYTVDVRVTDEAGIDGLVLTDYLGASLEFLGCGGIDNTTGGAVEYPGAPPLSGTPAVAGCTFPDAVETVENPPASGSTVYPPGVYTALTWDLGDLPAGATASFSYAAGVGLFENVPFTGTAPDPSGGAQAANLDNNSGPSTRETSSNRQAVNTARLAGTYLGPVEPGTSDQVEGDDTIRRAIEDVRIRKGVTPGSFVAGGRATYTVQIDTSEYTSAADIVLTDRAPNGVCPLGAAGSNFSDDADPICSSNVTTEPSVDYASATHLTGGGYEVVFEPIALASSSTTTVTYQAGMRPTYERGPNDGEPTVAGDQFVNTVAVSAETTPIPDSPETGDVTVGDESEAVLTTDGLSLEKRVRTRLPLFGAAETCPTTSSDYAEPADIDPEALIYRLGDRVCFLLRVDFPSLNFTKDADLTDFLPIGVEYEAGSMLSTAANSTPIDFNETEAAAGTEPPIWLLGTDGVGGRFVNPGAVFEVVLAARVVDLPDSDSPELKGNLMKMRTLNTGGGATSYRDEVPFAVTPAPTVSITKGVAEVDVPAFSTTDPDQDGIEVAEGSIATFRIDISNDGADATSNAYSIRGLDVWDVLPAGVACAQVSAITNFTDGDPGDPIYGTCTDPGDGGHPPFALQATRSAIRWDFPVAPGDVDRFAIDAGATKTLTYDMEIPTPTASGSRLVNDASVRSFDAFTNVLDIGSTYFPADNVDTTVTPDQETAPIATDPSDVVTPGPTLDKTGVTSIDEPRNNLPNEAVSGEIITYTYAVEVPADTSIFEGELSDSLPGRVDLVAPAPTARYYPDADDATSEALPAGFAVSADGTLTFPPVWTNPEPTTGRFEVTATVRVDNDFGGQPNLVNTVDFASLDAVGGSPIDTPAAQYSVRVRRPNPRLTKTVAPEVALGGTTVEFTLEARNGNRPALHDAWLEDCIPDGLTFDAFGIGSGTTIGPEAGDPAGNGCAPDEEYVAFSLDQVGRRSTVVRTFTATVDLDAVGGDVYRNRATLTGSTLDDGKAAPGDPDNPDELVLSRSDTADVTVPGAGITKSVDPEDATIGERVAYTLRVTVPAATNYYQAAVIDSLPAGLDASSLQLTGTTCTTIEIPAQPCALVGTLLPPETAPGGFEVAAFLFGDVLAAPVPRLLIVDYTAVVADVGSNVVGAQVINAANTAWDEADGGDVPDSPLYDWDLTGSTDIATVVVTEPNMSIGKTVSDEFPAPGDVFTYTISLENASGPNVSEAYDVEVSDVIPAGVIVDGGTFSAPPDSFVPATATTPGAISWTFDGPFAPGAAGTVTYDATLAASGLIDGTVRTNTVSLDSYDSLPTGGREYVGGDADAGVAPQFPDLVIGKTAVDAAPTFIGEEFTWSVTVQNDGDAPAFGVSVVDDLPTNWTYVTDSATVTFPDGTTEDREPALTPIGDPDTATWVSLGELDPAESLTITYRAVATSEVVDDPGVGSSIPQTNTARALGVDGSGASGNADGTYGSDDATASTRIDAVNLVLEKTHATAPVAGEEFIWSIDVRNGGTDVAEGPFTVTDTLPADVAFVDATGTGWSCAHDSGDVTCSRTNGSDTLDPGEAFPTISVTVAIDADTPAGTDYVNTASVEGRTYDTDTADNTDDDTATVATEADLAISKGRTDDAVAGDDVTYTLDVQNQGPSTSRASIVVTDDLPDSSTFVSAVGVGWTCVHDGSASGGEVTCTRATDLDAGASAGQIAVTVAVLSDATGDIVNEATVAGTTADPNPDNDNDDDTTTVLTSADLRIEKSSPGDLVAGENAVYRLRVDNAGPSDAGAVVRITDDLPDGLTYVSAADVTGTWSCSSTNPGATSFECDLDGALTAGGFAVVDVTVSVPSSAPARIVNTATVSSPTPDPDPLNNSDDDDSSVDGEADLSVSKTSSGPAIAGGTATWTITVQNLGPSDSPGDIVVTDALPSGVSFASATGAGWACAEVAGEVTCTLAAGLTAGQTAAPIALTVDVATDAGPAVIENTASVDGPVTDPDPSNNSDDDELSVVDQANILVVKDAVAPTAIAGGQATFTLSVSNEGPSAADAITVLDSPPTGMTVASASGDGWDCSATTALELSCSRASIDATETVPAITLVVDIGPDVGDGATLVNEATVDTSTPGDDPADNTDEASIEISTEADLSVDKSHPGDPVEAGTDVTFDLVVVNGGPSDARAPIVVTDRLPVGMTFVSSQGAWTCVPTPAGPTGQDVTCTSTDGDLPAGATAPTLSLTVAIDPDQPAGPLVNRAEVESTTPDPDPDDNTSEDQVDVVVDADLSVTKRHDGPVDVGDSVTFEIAVVNDGPSTATGVVMTDPMPAGLTPTGATGTGWSCAVLDRTVTCTLDSPLPPGASTEPIMLSADVDAAAYPTAENIATVSSETPDSDPSNDRATDVVTVIPLVDVVVSKSRSGEVVVGESLEYVLSVENLGPTADPGPVTVVDELPSSLVPVSASSDGADCSVAGQVVTCVAAGGLPVSGSFEVSVVVDVLPSAYPEVVNTAVVSTESDETDETNNSATDTAAVDPVIELDVVKAVAQQADRDVVWSITVSNTGLNGTVEPIIVTDARPDGLEFVSASGAGWSCIVDAVIECTYGAQLAAGASAPPISIVSVLTSSAGVAVTNTAVASGGGPGVEAVSDAAAAVSDTELPATGAEHGSTLRLGWVLLLAGLTLLVASRRRRLDLHR